MTEATVRNGQAEAPVPQRHWGRILSLLLMAAAAAPAAVEWTTYDGVSIPVPPAEHPRLYLRAADLPDLQRRTTHPVLRPVWESLLTFAKNDRVLSFEVDGSGEDACRVAEAFNLFTLAPSLGGVDSLVTIPVLTSHAMIDAELRRKMGVTEQMIRISVGIENADDLIADLEKGLAVLSRKREHVGAAD